ncbi:hypothetical protein CcaverHIS002_0108520 [Cutaneotrichosporon cavernicola]|nr:hypothetical protein CcaverHIS002_0108520 [Cutaneotrichosporon cavernicola]
MARAKVPAKPCEGTRRSARLSGKKATPPPPRPDRHRHSRRPSSPHSPRLATQPDSHPDSSSIDEPPPPTPSAIETNTFEQTHRQLPRRSSSGNPLLPEAATCPKPTTPTMPRLPVSPMPAFIHWPGPQDVHYKRQSISPEVLSDSDNEMEVDVSEMEDDDSSDREDEVADSSVGDLEETNLPEAGVPAAGDITVNDTPTGDLPNPSVSPPTETEIPLTFEVVDDTRPPLTPTSGLPNPSGSSPAEADIPFTFQAVDDTYATRPVSRPPPSAPRAPFFRRKVTLSLFAGKKRAASRLSQKAEANMDLFKKIKRGADVVVCRALPIVRAVACGAAVLAAGAAGKAMTYHLLKGTRVTGFGLACYVAVAKWQDTAYPMPAYPMCQHIIGLEQTMSTWLQ